MPLPKGVKPRFYQTGLYNKIRTAFSTYRAVLAKSSTGSGKSVLMTMIVDAFLRLNKRMALERHLYFLVDEKFLLNQFSGHCNKWNIPHDIIGDGKREGRDVQIHICTIQTLSKHPPKREPTLFIIDEAHFTTAARFMDLFENHPDSKILGLTATDETGSGKGLSKESGNGIFDVMVESDVTMRQLTEGVEITDEGGITSIERYLAPVKYYGIPIKGIENLGMQTGEYKNAEVAKLLKDRGTFGDAIKEMQKIPDVDKFILFFCKSVPACYEMQTILHANNYTAEVLEGKLTKAKRREVMRGFESGETQVLVTCKMVQKGADLPSLLLAVDIQPTPSRGTQRQKIGRGTRMSEGKEFFYYLDMVGNHRVFPDSDIYAEWESNFHSKKFNKKPVGTGEENVCPLCYALIPVGKTQCPDCGADKLKPKPKTKKEKHLDGDLVEIKPIPLKDRSTEDKTAVNKSISKAIVDNDIEALYKIAVTITNKSKAPIWVYYQLRKTSTLIDMTLLYRIQRQLKYSTGWVHFVKKQIRLDQLIDCPDCNGTGNACKNCDPLLNNCEDCNYTKENLEMVEDGYICVKCKGSGTIIKRNS